MNERPHPNDDLWYAITYNTPATFTAEDVRDILAEVPGANDDLAWWWILSLHDGRTILLSAWCDYTGWACRSRIKIEEEYPDALTAASGAPPVEEYSNRGIRANLMAQIRGEQPKYIYDAGRG